jgi:DNA mismatch endonuclease (patch repair protein)
MQSNVGREARPEERLRLAVAAAGAEFLTNVRPEPSLRCRADFVFSAERVCVFVDGCFWHRCPEHYAAPKSNASWWEEKLTATVERDVRQTEELRALGWTVHRVWEHETTPHEVAAAAARLLPRRRARK